MVAAARAQGTQKEQLAKANLLRLQKQELIGYGSQSLARSILGEDPTLGAISDDPRSSFSFLANLRRSYGVPIGQQENWMGAARTGYIPEAEEAMNPDNLWFSSYHADRLRQLQQQQLMEQSKEEQRIQGTLGGYQQDYLDAVNAAKEYVQQLILQRQNAMAVL
jgi:hypothetical protein